MIFSRLIAVFVFCLTMGNSIGQAQPTTIEVESKGTITFSPDSFVVKLSLDRGAVNLTNYVPKEIVADVVMEMPVEMDVAESDYSTLAQDDAPPKMEVEDVKSPEQMRKERERFRIIEDSLQGIKANRMDEFESKLIALGVQIPKKEDASDYSRYGSRMLSWTQCFTSQKYRMIDSLSKIYGRPLNLEMIDVKMKDHIVLKERAYRQAIENSNIEAESLAKAMGRKVGKMTSVKTEAIDLMDIVPLMLRKEIQREVRKSDRFLQPALYQLSQELGNNFFEKDRSDEKNIIFWTWSEKIKVTYILN
jgi:hypothetical protein